MNIDFQCVEGFFKAYQYTFEALGAIGTLLAVIISLFFGYRSLKTGETNISASVYVSTLVTKEPNESKQTAKGTYITVSITNQGIFPVRIPFYFFAYNSLIRQKGFGYAVVNPLDGFNVDPYIPKKIYPFIIEPKRNETFFAGNESELITNIVDSFYKSKNNLTKLSIKRYIPLLLYIYFIRIKIRTEDGKLFNAKIDKKLRKEILAASKISKSKS